MSRVIFLAVVRALEGVPYRWGGKTARGLDCSGLVTVALRAAGGPDLRAMHNADALYRLLPPTTTPRAGDLAFYGLPERATHVDVCLGDADDPVIGARGGDRTTTTLAAADEKDARVKLARSPKYRRDLLGFRSTAGWWGE